MDSVSLAAAVGNDNDGDSSSPSPPLVAVTIERVGEEGANRPRARGRESSNNFMGKHRLAAAINQIHLQIQFIQEELEQLQTLGEASLVCKEFISSVESKADALLPMTKGLGDEGWDRWFQGNRNSCNRKRWI